MKQVYKGFGNQYHQQPPSGGCVLKLFRGYALVEEMRAAAFGRLCVETIAPTLKRW